MTEEEETLADKISCLFSRLDTRETYKEIESDVTIIAGEYPDTRQFSVDSFLLNIASPILENLVQQANNGNVYIRDASPSIIEKMLRYIYTYKLPVDEPQEAMELFIIAKIYQLPHLQSLCNKYLNEVSVTVSNAANLFEIAYENGFCNILSKSAEWLFKRTDEFLENGGLSSASQTLVEKLVKDAFSVSEASLVNKVLEWCSMECRKRNILQAGSEDKREILKNILPHIYFLRLSNEDFADIVIPYQVLTSDEITGITSNKNASQSRRLPFPEDMSNKLDRQWQCIPLNFHSESFEREKNLSINDTFSLIFWTEKDCFIERLALPVIFYPGYQFTMIFQITLTNLKTRIKYKIPSARCDVRCENAIANFQVPCSLYAKQRIPLKLKVKITKDPASIKPVVISRPPYPEPLHQIILKTSRRKGKYEWLGKPIAYIPDCELKEFQISGLLLMF